MALHETEEKEEVTDLKEHKRYYIDNDTKKECLSNKTEMFKRYKQNSLLALWFNDY